MSASAARRDAPHELVAAPLAMLPIGAAAAVLLAIGLAFEPRAVAWGWLVGFLFWSSVPLGSILLTLTHETTGGRWGLAAAPLLRLGSVSALFLPLFFALIFAGLRTLYPWANGGASTSTRPGILRVFMGFGARS